MAYILEYDKHVPKDLRKIPYHEHKRIESAIYTKLVTAPLIFGIRLKGTLKNFGKFRVGNYRIIFEIRPNKTLYIGGIIHRSSAYEEILRRFGL